MITDSELKKNCTYRVKIIEHENEKLINKIVEVKFTGIFFRGKKKDNVLYLHQVEVLEAVET